jgi:ribonuclease VapC
MVIDTSALLALLFHEPEASSVAKHLSETAVPHISALTVFESKMVVAARKGPQGTRELDLLFHTLDFKVVPLDSEQSDLAMEAWSRFGKGRHKASLNLGDCCSYALSKKLGLPLMYKGNDFSETDLDCVHV